MTKERGRRRFLKDGAVFAGLAVGAMKSASGQAIVSETSEGRLKEELRAYGKRSRFETSVRIPTEGRPWPIYVAQRMTPLQDSVGIITPASLHFISSHGYDPPDIDPEEHRLLIHGMVDRPLTLSVKDLKRLPSVSRIHFIECAGNSSLRHLKQKNSPGAIQGVHGETSCSEWTGVELSLLLNEAGVQKGASWLLAEGADKNKLTKSVPLEKAMDDAMVVYGQNGEALRPEQGYPLRLLLPGWEGVSNVKWLRRFKLVDQPYMTIADSSQYTSLMPSLKGKARWFQFEMPPKSIITFPSDAHHLSGPGFYEITGLAWSGAGAVRRVEVSLDAGQTWKDAKLQEPVFRKAHTRFRLNWNWNGAEVVLQSRCTDEVGNVQPTVAELAKIWGVEPEYFLTSENAANHFNAIQPWKITADGSVHNAMYS